MKVVRLNLFSLFDFWLRLFYQMNDALNYLPLKNDKIRHKGKKSVLLLIFLWKYTSLIHYLSLSSQNILEMRKANYFVKKNSLIKK